MRQLSGTDASMLFSDTPHAQNIIAPVNIYDPSTAPGGAVTFDDVLAFIGSRLDVSDSFRERLVHVPLNLDRPYWVRDAHFDLEYHVREIALPAPGDWRQFCTQVARLCARPLDMTRPPWELYVVGGLDAIEGVPPGSFAMVLKLHHAAVDGVAGAEMITVLHDTEPLAAPTEISVSHWEPEETPSGWSLVAKAGKNALTRPASALGSVVPGLRGVPSMVRQSREAGTGTGLLTATRFNHDVSAHRVYGMAQFDLASFKRIRTAVPGAKVNDVGLALVGGALRRYLASKDELPEEALFALMPISVRPTQTQQAKDRSADAAAGNSFTMMPISMATDVGGPLERLQRIVTATSVAKNADPVAARTLTEISELLPGVLMGTVQRALTRTANRSGRALGTHTIVTNVPGPQVPVYFCGARAVIMTGMAPVVDGMGLINAIGSYNGDIPICFSADRAMMPDPELYEECLRDSFTELLAIAPVELTDGAPPPAAARKVTRKAAGSARASGNGGKAAKARA